MFQRFLYLLIKCKRAERLLDGIVVYSFRFQLAEQDVRAFAVCFFVGARIGFGKFFVI